MRTDRMRNKDIRSTTNITLTSSINACKVDLGSSCDQDGPSKVDSYGNSIELRTGSKSEEIERK